MLRSLKDPKRHTLSQAQARYAMHNFKATENIANRQQAVLTALAGIGQLAFNSEKEKNYYQKLLEEERDELAHPVQHAQARFNAHNFSNEAIIASRYQAILAAITNIGLTVNISDPIEKAHYYQLLIKERNSLETSMVQAKLRFDTPNFNNQTNIAARYQRVIVAIQAVNTIVCADQNEIAHYQQLLAKEREQLQTSMRLAQTRFDLYNFTNIGDINERCKTILETIADINKSIIIEHPLERAHFHQLLVQTRDNTLKQLSVMKTVTDTKAIVQAADKMIETAKAAIRTVKAKANINSEVIKFESASAKISEADIALGNLKNAEQQVDANYSEVVNQNLIGVELEFRSANIKSLLPLVRAEWQTCKDAISTALQTADLELQSVNSHAGLVVQDRHDLLTHFHLVKSKALLQSNLDVKSPKLALMAFPGPFTS